MAASSSSVPASAPALPAPVPAPSPTPVAGRNDRRPQLLVRGQASPIVASDADFDAILAELARDEVFIVPPPPGDGAVAYIEEQIALLRPCVYKIGITWHPARRYYNVKYGYVHDGFTAMHVLMASSPFKCAQMETDLISHFFEKPGCYNIAKGGENPPPEGSTCFCYLVTAKADERWQLYYNRKRRRRT